MATLSTLVFVLGAAWALPALCSSAARAEGCYTCASGSRDTCRDSCRYPGQDTFAARKQCEKNGCKVSGVAPCPTAPSAKVCRVETAAPDRSGPVLAAIPWCAASPNS